MSPRGWENLALAAVLTLYLLQIGNVLINGMICQPLAFDYCAFWSAGKIINERGIADIYDLDILSQFQKDIYPQANSSSIPFTPVDVPYLPIFFLPFQFFSLINLPLSYVIWTLINLIGLICYLRFFTMEVAGYSLSFRLLLFILLSLPVFINLHEGQVNIWLGVCAGEFMRAILTDKPYKAGAWLGGWLLKPQLLIFIIPFLLIKRSMKALSGFIISTTAVMTISFGLINTNGLLNYINIARVCRGRSIK